MGNSEHVQCESNLWDGVDARLLVVTTSGSQPTESPAGHSPRRARATGSATTASNTSPNSSRPSSGSGNGNATGTSGAMSGSSSPDAAKLHILLGYRARSANASLANEGGVGTADLGDDKDTPLVGSECVVEWVGALNTAGARSISRQATTEDPTIRDTASFADNYSLSWRNGSYYTALAAYSQREEDKSLVVNTVNTSTNSTNSAVAGQGWKPLSGALLAGSEADEERFQTTPGVCKSGRSCFVQALRDILRCPRVRYILYSRGGISLNTPRWSSPTHVVLCFCFRVLPSLWHIIFSENCWTYRCLAPCSGKR